MKGDAVCVHCEHTISGGLGVFKGHLADTHGYKPGDPEWEDPGVMMLGESKIENPHYLPPAMPSQSYLPPTPLGGGYKVLGSTFSLISMEDPDDHC